MWVVLVEEFGMELDAEEWAIRVLHGLERRGLVAGGLLEASGEFFDFVVVGLPDGDAAGEALKDSLAVGFHIEEAALAQATPVACGVWFEPLDNIHACAVAEGNLLMAAADAQDGLRRVAYDVKDSDKRRVGVVIPRVALAAQDDVRRA